MPNKFSVNLDEFLDSYFVELKFPDEFYVEKNFQIQILKCLECQNGFNME